MKMARRIVMLVLFAGIISLSLTGCKKDVATDEEANPSVEKMEGEKAKAEQDKTAEKKTDGDEKKDEHPKGEHPK